MAGTWVANRPTFTFNYPKSSYLSTVGNYSNTRPHKQLQLHLEIVPLNPIWFMGTHLWITSLMHSLCLMFSVWPSSESGLWFSLCRRVLSMAFPCTPKMAQPLLNNESILGHPARFCYIVSECISSSFPAVARLHRTHITPTSVRLKVTEFQGLLHCSDIFDATAVHLWSVKSVQPNKLHNLHFGRRSSAIGPKKTVGLMQQFYRNPPREVANGWQRIECASTWWQAPNHDIETGRSP